MQNVLIGDRLFAIPSTYNETTPRQIRAIVRYSAAKMRADVRFFLILLCLMDLPGRFWLRFRWFFKLDKAEAMLEILDFKEEINLFLSSKTPFYSQKFPVLGRFWKLYGPGDALSGITFRQFRMAEEIGYRYRESESEDDLNELLAVLYLREPYKKFEAKTPASRMLDLENDQAYKTQRIARLPLDLRQAIFLWYQGSRSVLIKQFPRIFLGKKADAQESESQATADAIAESYANLLDGLAETAPNYVLWDSTSIYDVLHNYQQRLREADRIKEQRRQKESA